MGRLYSALRCLVLGLGALLLAACASGPAPISPETPEASERSSNVPTPAVPSTKPETPAVSPVDRLLEQAKTLRQEGDLPASFARLERALRIAPQRAEVYLELALSHVAAGSPERASASAERGLLYCNGSTCRELRRFIDS
ncbi:hypothetical protein R0137_16880 [Congregibacter brevis]|uniref:Tetratricopeptide repeat protein n=1 Tax=Congregibacter brevis TaxID=3081201 RepID=A0ABZ0ICQ8_9GAMM|nr:hypothetical protein R0137_16880 [Congregibacter sp. IMCC45268]